MAKFVLPNKKFPISSKQEAAGSAARVDQGGSPWEKRAVKATIKKKFGK